jgi:hypothetical protein
MTEIPRKMSKPFPTYRSKEAWYQLPEICYLPENMALYQRCRLLCIRHTLPYPQAREKHLEMEAKRYPEVPLVAVDKAVKVL